MQGDIVRVYNSDGVSLVSYVYTAWGERTSTTYHHGGANTTVTNNPFTYRGYYYDKDLDLYYLQSRYYDSKVCRFISPDTYISTGQGIIGHNMYAYCNNNPVNYVDHTGNFPWLVVAILVLPMIVGGILGSSADFIIADDGKNGYDFPESGRLTSDNLKDSAEFDSNSQSQCVDTHDLTTKDRIRNTVLGASLGVVTAGGILMLIGAGGSFVVGSASIVILGTGMTGAQIVAAGALAFNILPILILPLIEGEETDPVEMDTNKYQFSNPAIP